MIKESKVNIVEKIKKKLRVRTKKYRVVEKMKKVGVKMLQEEEWEMKKKLVLKEGKVYVSKDKELRVEII